jgi:hypothetical protein
MPSNNGRAGVKRRTFINFFAAPGSAMAVTQDECQRMLQAERAKRAPTIRTNNIQMGS